MSTRILIADDYEDNRELLRIMLEGAGYSVMEARDGRECVQMAQASLPDLCLIDLSMPVLDGWGAIEELRADPRTRHVPCVAVTAFADPERARRALDHNFDAYITKPFRTPELLDTVERLLKVRRADLMEQGGK